MASAGDHLYGTNCAVCHGVHGEGTRIGPSLLHIRARTTPASLTAIILDPAPPMPRLEPGHISRRDVSDIVAYLQTL